MVSRSEKALKGAGVNIAQYAILVALQVFTTPLILNKLGEEALGGYAIIMQIVGYSLLLDFGFSVALGRFLSQAFGQVDLKAKFLEIANIGRLVLLLTNFASSVILIVASKWVSQFFTATEATILQMQYSLWLYAAWLTIRTPFQIYAASLLASQELAAYHLIAIVGNLSRLLLTIAAVLSGSGIIGLIAAAIIAELIGLLLYRRQFRKIHFSLFSFFGDWVNHQSAKFLDMIRFGLQYFGVRVAQIATTGSDALLVGYLFNAAQVAQFYTTKMPAFLMVQVVFKISDNASPAINELLGSGDIDAVRSAYLRIIKYSFILAFPLAIGVVTFNQSLISLWVGPELFAGQIMTVALSFYVLTQTLAHIDAMVVVATDRMRHWTTLSVFLAITYLILAGILGHYFGAQWIMVAMTLIDIPGVIFLHRRATQTLNVSLSSIMTEALLPALRGAGPFAIFAMVMINVDPSPNSLYMAAYTSILLITWVFSTYAWSLVPQEREYIKRSINRNIKLGNHK